MAKLGDFHMTVTPVLSDTAIVALRDTALALNQIADVMSLRPGDSNGWIEASKRSDQQTDWVNPADIETLAEQIAKEHVVSVSADGRRFECSGHDLATPRLDTDTEAIFNRCQRQHIAFVALTRCECNPQKVTNEASGDEADHA